MQIGINSNSLERWFERGVNIFNELAPFCYVLNLVGSGIFFLAMLLGFTDVILRYIFGTPITGAGEAIGLSLVFIVFLGLSYVALNKRHVNIDIIINLLPAKSRTATNIITDILSIGIIGLMLVQSIRYGLIAMGTGAIVSLLHVPTFPFIFVIAFSLILLLAVLLRDFLEDLVSGLKLQFAPWLWVTLFIVTILLIFIAILWLQPGSLEFKPITTGLIGLGVFFILLFSGMPIAYGLFLVSFLFLGHTTNLQAAFALLGAFPFRVVDNYTWAVIALFVIMGYILFFARFGADLFETAYKWIGHFKGGLAIATVGASTAFAAIIGDATSATATMSAAALPEMRKYEYDTALATGCIAAAATLGPMIPPSVSFIVYGLITITSIGSLFISGIFPGIILALLFSLIIYFRCARNPKLGPKGPRYNLRTKLKSLTSAIPVIMLFIVSIGGIYSGVFTPTEGGAVGGTGALILSLIMNPIV